jgi:Flp pilus assembly pilin Flp
VTWFSKLLADDSGATMVEYALVSAVLSVAMIAAVAAIAAECGARLSVTTGKMTLLGTNPT